MQHGTEYLGQTAFRLKVIVHMHTLWTSRAT